MKKERILYLDILRIFAFCAVVMIHTSAIFIDPTNATHFNFAIGNFFDSISRLGVPLFLMISGSLMLNENRSFNLKKSVLRLLCLFFIWSFLYSFAYNIALPIINNNTINVVSFFTALFKGHYHLWYMFAIIGLYLITPILRCFTKKENKKLVLYFIGLTLLFQFMSPLLNILLLEINIFGLSSDLLSTYNYILSNLNLEFLGGLTAYYLAGWYLSTFELSNKSSRILYVLGAIGIILTIVLTQLFPNQFQLTYSNLNVCIFFYSISFYLLIQRICKDKKHNNSFISTLSNLTFGGYLLHIFILTIVSKFLLKSALWIPMVWLITIIICFAITLLISKLPIIKKIIKT